MKQNYYDRYLEEYKQKYSKYNSNNSNKIRSDFNLILLLLKDLFLYLLLLIPKLIALLFFIIIFNSQKTKVYFRKIFFEPFLIFVKIKDWFFEAKITSFLIVFLIFAYFIQIFFLGNFMEMLMVHPNHFFEGNFISIFTSIFLHANLIHLLSNCVALLIFGRIVERKFKTKMLFIFVLSGIIANFVSNFISYFQGDLFYSLGASGAIAGLIILAILIDPFDFTIIFVIPLPIFVIGWFLISLDIIGLTNPSLTNHFAHLGGYFALLIIFFFLELKERKKVITGFMINLCLLLLLYVFSKAFDLKELVYFLF